MLSKLVFIASLTCCIFTINAEHTIQLNSVIQKSAIIRSSDTSYLQNLDHLVSKDLPAKVIQKKLITQEINSNKPRISIVIDDLGDNSIIAKKMLSLPLRVTAAILPHTPHAKVIANFASGRGHEVIMHLPMEASTRPDLLGPGALYADMGESEILSTMRSSAASIPHMVGFNNHMGSMLTKDKEKMQWVMQTASQNGWYFLDSKTSQSSVAQDVAEATGIASLGRDLFLDHKGSDNSPGMMQQFKKMQTIASRKGYVIVICHPYPETLAFLTQHTAELLEDFELVSLSQIIQSKKVKRGLLSSS